MNVAETAKNSMAHLPEILMIIDKEMHGVVSQAQAICDLHWQSITEERGDRSIRYITRIQGDGGVLQCQWLLSGTKPLGTGKIMAKLVPKGTARFNPRYKASSFNKAEPWEYEIITETEENYARLRERHMQLVKIRADFLRYVKNTKDSYERLGILWNTTVP